MGRIVTALQKQKGLARHEIADATGLTRTTVSKAVTELLDKDLVEELGPGPASSRGGRRPIGLKLNPHAFNVVGLDIRREKITGCLVNLGGKIETVATRKMARGSTTEAYVGAVGDMIVELKRRSRSMVTAIGVGSIGPINVADGVIHSRDFPALRNVALVDRLVEAFGIPTALRVGAIMAAYGEERIAADQSTAPRSVAFIVIDYGGIGLGLISGGAAWLTNHGGVGELGHLTIDLAGRPCHCGRRGCLTQYASGRALVESLGQSGDQSEAAEASLAQIALDAEAGDAAARSAIIQAGEYLGCGIVDVDRLLRPERIVVGGSHDHLADWYMHGVHRHIEQIQERSGADPKLIDRISLAQKGSTAIAFGAAAMQLEHFVRAPNQILSLLPRVGADARAAQRLAGKDKQDHVQLTTQ